MRKVRKTEWVPVLTHTYAIPMRTRFRGITRREGMVFRGAAGWAEWSPFREYSGDELVPWLLAAQEVAELGWPAAVRDVVPVNATIPAVSPAQAHVLTARSGCRTAKVKVGEPGQGLADDLDRVEAVRDALGPAGLIRIDANGSWDLDRAVASLRQLARFDLEYAEQPCRTTEELAELRLRLARAGLNVLVAADESVRRADDPLRVAELEAADIAVLKVQPLGGVRACLEIAERIGLPVVVSSALETSVGIRAGLALAAALPELPYACGLNTVPLLTDDLVASPLVAVDGFLSLSDTDVAPAALERCAADEFTTQLWQGRLRETSERLAASARAAGRG